MLSRNLWRTARNCGTSMRGYASSSETKKLRIGYVPEHFATPLFFAQKHYDLNADLQPQPDGTGPLCARLKASAEEKQLDVAFGLTEGFIADLGKTKAAGQQAGYQLAGTYVQSPLRWAISTGAGRDDVQDVDGLKGSKVGVSRVGSGSYVMSFVLAEQRGWMEADKDTFEVVPLGDFAALRKGVAEGAADWFMWDHTTSAKYWGNGELKRIGELYTPWPSWSVAAHSSRVEPERLEELMQKVNQGIVHFHANPEEAVEHITGTMHYSEADAREWMKSVLFSEDVVGVDPAMVDRTAETLRKTGVLKAEGGGRESDWMIAILRGA